MAQDYTSSALITSVKRRGMLPSTDETLATADFLAILNDEIQTYLVPLLMSVREEYLVGTSVVSGATSYPIPVRAIGGKLRSVEIASGDSYVPLVRIEPEQRSSGAEGYLVEGNRIVLLPESGSAATLRLKYFRRPSSLVATSAVGTLSAAYAAGSTALVLNSTAPSTFTNATAVDVVSATPGFDASSDDLTLSSPSGTAATVAAPGLTEAAASGDYVCLAGESPVPQVPVELHPLLVERATFVALKALGNPRAGEFEASAEKMKARVTMLLAPRVEGSTRVIINRSGPGFGGGRRRRAF